MLDEKNSIDNLKSPSTYNQQPQIMKNNDYQNQQVQYQILSNQLPIQYLIIPNQSVQYQMPNQNNQYIILPNLNSQIQTTPQISYGLPVKENIYNP